MALPYFETKRPNHQPYKTDSELYLLAGKVEISLFLNQDTEYSIMKFISHSLKPKLLWQITKLRQLSLKANLFESAPLISGYKGRRQSVVCPSPTWPVFACASK